jgi:hypothetical protein
MPVGWEAVIQQGGVVGIAMFAMLMLQKTWERNLKEVEQQRQILVDVVKANTVAMTDNVAVARESITASRELCQEVRTVLSVVRRAKKVDA